MCGNQPPKRVVSKRFTYLIVHYSIVIFCIYIKLSCVYNNPKIDRLVMRHSKKKHAILRASSTKSQKPAKSRLYLNVNIFRMMHGKLTDLQILTQTGKLCVYAKCDSAVIDNQGEKSVLKTAQFGEIMANFHA